MMTIMGILYWQEYKNKPETKVFFGTVIGVENNTINVSGFPNVNEPPLGVKIVVTVDPDTKIIKESGGYKLRVTPSLDKPASRDDITRDRLEVDFIKFKEDASKEITSVKIVSDRNIYGLKKFIAKEIYFNIDNHFYDR